jgi:predicted DNA-binding transcriptional regulator YafY
MFAADPGVVASCPFDRSVPGRVVLFGNTMARNFARYEQFLRIFAVLEILSTARQPLEDQALIAALKERLGLSRLSARTLHRDCEFLQACGYPIDHPSLHGGRRHGWVLHKELLADRRIPAEPITILELVAFMVGRDLLRTFEGTVLWTGIESLRSKIERAVPGELLTRMEAARGVFHVTNDCPSRYASRPRLISALSTAITDCHEIEVGTRADDGRLDRQRIRPLRLVIEPPRVRLLGFSVAGAEDPPVLIDIDRIEALQALDTSFVPPASDVLESLTRSMAQP